MIERRQSTRSRVIYGGVVGYNRRQTTVECVIRNFSDTGANVEFADPAVLPEIVDLLVAKKNRAFTAKVAWRHSNMAGLAFTTRRRRCRSIGCIDCGPPDLTIANSRAASRHSVANESTGGLILIAVMRRLDVRSSGRSNSVFNLG